MATFLTPTIISDVATLALMNELQMGKLVYRGHDKEYKKVGSTARVRVPATFTAIEFDGDLTGEFQNITESYVDVTLDTILTVPFEITQKEASLDLKDLTEQVIMPAVRALAQGIDYKLTGLYNDIPYYVDVAGTPVVADISGVRKKLLNNKVPMDADLVWGVMCPDTEAKYNVLDAFLHAEKRGDTTNVKTGFMGRLFGVNWVVDQNVRTHVIGTTDLAGTAGNASVGATTLVASALGTGTVNKGTIFTIAGDTTQYVVTANATISGNAATLLFYPALVVATSTNPVLTIHAIDKANLVFHRNAFCLATAPLVEPLGGANAATKTYEGLSLQTVFSFNHNALKNVGTMSILCGVKTLQKELALRFCDA